MMRSMYSGVSGLKVHQTKMDVIGNNIANVNTLGFKSSRVVFSEVFSQTISGATAPNANQGGTNPMQIGLGTDIASIDIDMSEGANQRTDKPLDLKISGDGFFVVSNAGGNAFTRAGAFGLDKAGNLTNSNGMYVMGWGVDGDTQKIQRGDVNKLQILSPKNANALPEASENFTIQGNINPNDTDFNKTPTPGIFFTSSIYDSLGSVHTATFRLTKDTANNTYRVNLDKLQDENGNVENLTSTGSSASGTTGTSFEVGYLKFNKDGSIDTANSSKNGDNMAGFGLKIETDPTTSEFDFGGKPISFDLSNINLFNGTTNVTCKGGDENGLHGGSKAGKISGYEIGNDGRVVGRYTNGATKVLGQLAVAKFDNPAGLQKLGGNLFVPTSNSGDFDGIGVDVTTSGGAIQSGVLEMSNVDLSREFTDMITTQRGFQANSRIITTSDSILEELVNLKR